MDEQTRQALQVIHDNQQMMLAVMIDARLFPLSQRAALESLQKYLRGLSQMIAPPEDGKDRGYWLTTLHMVEQDGENFAGFIENETPLIKGMRERFYENISQLEQFILAHTPPSDDISAG